MTLTTHHGTFEELKAGVEKAGLIGEWRDLPNGVHKFTCKDRAGISWSETKGTLWYDGPVDVRDKAAAALEAALTGEPTDTDKAILPAREKTIFVVHGHDPVAREQLELVLHKLGLQPYVLQNTDGGGLTIVENLEKMIGKNAASSFGIVLMTPDDMGYAKREGEKEIKARARQNVILEMGMLLASLTRPRVAILQKGFVEHPSDIQGILYIPFNDHVKETVPKLAGRLQAAGIALEPAKIAHASA